MCGVRGGDDEALRTLCQTRLLALPLLSGASEVGAFALHLCLLRRSASSHQYLPQIWFAHKRMCGEKAKPLRFPLLSQPEYGRTKEWLYTKMENDGGSFTIASRLQVIFNVSPSLVGHLLEGLRENSAQAMSFTAQLPPQLLAEGLTFIRSTLHAHVGTVVATASEAKAPFCEASAEMWPELWDAHLAVGYFAMHLGTQLFNGEHQLEPYPIDSKWYCDLIHSLLILRALLYRRERQKQKKEEPQVNYKPFLSYAGSQVVQAFLEVQKVDERIAEPLFFLLQATLLESGTVLKGVSPDGTEQGPKVRFGRWCGRV
jgi:hypothetical protein